MGYFSGCLVSSASVQKLFCGILSVFKWSFVEFVGDKVVSPSYSSILGPPPLDFISMNRYQQNKFQISWGDLRIHTCQIKKYKIWWEFKSLRQSEVIQFSSVIQSCPTLCDPMNCSTPGLPVHHELPEFTQTHAHRVGDAIQSSHPLSSHSPPALNPS